MIRRIPASRDLYGAPIETKTIQTKSSDIRPVAAVTNSPSAVNQERERTPEEKSPSDALTENNHGTNLKEISKPSTEVIVLFYFISQFFPSLFMISFDRLIFSIFLLHSEFHRKS